MNLIVEPEWLKHLGNILDRSVEEDIGIDEAERLIEQEERLQELKNKLDKAIALINGDTK